MAVSLKDGVLAVDINFRHSLKTVTAQGYSRKNAAASSRVNTALIPAEACPAGAYLGEVAPAGAFLGEIAPAGSFLGEIAPAGA